MPTLCTYVLKKDTGLAPNPYWDWCSLAVCTPNRQGARLSSGDWIAGFSSRATGNRLIYAMEVAERLHMNAYFTDPRFARKKPNLRGNWQERCGDNFYHQEPDGSWQQERNRFHIGPDWLIKDTRRPFVFVSRRFWYFGRMMVAMPPEFNRLVGTRGIRVNHPPEEVNRFIAWVASSHKPGIHALPNHNPDVQAQRAQS